MPKQSRIRQCLLLDGFASLAMTVLIRPEFALATQRTRSVLVGLDLGLLLGRGEAFEAPEQLLLEQELQER